MWPASWGRWWVVFFSMWTTQYIMAFVFAGILCFVASACSVVVWSLARTRARLEGSKVDRDEAVERFLASPR